jgi:hypothetical protein
MKYNGYLSGDCRERIGATTVQPHSTLLIISQVKIDPFTSVPTLKTKGNAPSRGQVHASIYIGSRYIDSIVVRHGRYL